MTDQNINKSTDQINEETKEQKKATLFGEFFQFIKKYGVVGLALGVVVGGAVKTLVDSLVLNLINPILGRVIGRVNFSELIFYDIKYGQFLTDAINFLILMFLVYLTIKFFISRFVDEEELKKI
jgi:large conductance mechanosensitive channel